MAHGPNRACCLFLKAKFYWNTITLICLCIVYGCSCAINAELSSCDRDWLTKPKIFVIWVLTKKVCWPCIREGILEKTWVWEEDNEFNLVHVGLSAFEKAKRWRRKVYRWLERWYKCLSQLTKVVIEVMKRNEVRQGEIQVRKRGDLG